MAILYSVKFDENKKPKIEVSDLVKPPATFQKENSRNEIMFYVTGMNIGSRSRNNYAKYEILDFLLPIKNRLKAVVDIKFTPLVLRRYPSIGLQRLISLYVHQRNYWRFSLQ